MKAQSRRSRSASPPHSPATPLVVMTPLPARIAARIREGGPLSFHDWMEAALYDPHQGYYRRPGPRVGRAGDFVTNVSSSPVLGQLLARRAHALWLELDRPAAFQLVEQGAEDGHLLADVLTALDGLAPALAAAVQPWIVEPHPPSRERQRAALPPAWRNRLQFAAGAAELPPLTGLFYANELLDAFSARLFRREPEGWGELGVDLDDDGRGIEVVLPPLSPALPPGLAADLPAPWTWEHQPALLPWLDALAGRLKRGAILLLDYGFTDPELRDPCRRHGTLRAYSRQRQQPPLAAPPGEMDLTVHVHWDELRARAAVLGLRETGFAEQGRVLTRLAAPWLRELEAAVSPPDPSLIRRLHSLLHPAHLGAKFQCLELMR